MNKFAIWKSKGGEYTVLKNHRVYVMSEKPDGKGGYDEYICTEVEIDPDWMEKYQHRIEFKDINPELRVAIDRHY